MGIRETWELGYTGKGVVVTIVDDGIEINHADLKQNYVRTFNNYIAIFLFELIFTCNATFKQLFLPGSLERSPT